MNQATSYWNDRAITYMADHGTAPVRLLAQKDIVRALRDAKVEHVLDAGGGAGHLAMAIKAEIPNCSLTVVDASSKMVSLARENLKFLDGVVTVIGDLADLSEIQTGSVDAYVSTFALHHLTDCKKAAALLEAKRILKPTGRLVIADEVISDRSLLSDPVALMRRVGEVFYPILTFAEVREKLNGLVEYPTGTEEMNRMLVDTGFDVVWKVYNDISALCTGTPVGGRHAQG